LVSCLLALVRPGSWKLKCRDLVDTVKSTGGQIILGIVFLADQARLAIDAVIRTLIRLGSHRRLLEWETAAAAEPRLGGGLGRLCIAMWVAPALGFGLAVLIAIARPESLLPAGPILLGWLVAPAVAFWISRRPRAREEPLSDSEQLELRMLARRTWDFF